MVVVCNSDNMQTVFWMGATHFLTKKLKNASTEMSLHVLAYNMKRVINLLGTTVLMEAMAT